jgi:hypothetical protein
LFAVLQGLHRRSPFTDFALVGAFIVVVIDPKVQIILQLINVLIDLLAERHLIEFLQNGFVEPLTDTVSILLIMFLVAFIFTANTSVDSTVSSRGKFTTKVPSVDVQAASSAVIKQIFVERGQLLKKGQLVAILDETDAKTNLAGNVEKIAAVERRLRRIKYEQELITSGSAFPKELNLSGLFKEILKKD